MAQFLRDPNFVMRSSGNFNDVYFYIDMPTSLQTGNTIFFSFYSVGTMAPMMSCRESEKSGFRIGVFIGESRSNSLV